MVVIKNYGLEEEIVSELSSVLSSDIASLCECGENDVVFISSGNVYHKGFDQMDYFAYVEVLIPGRLKKVGNLEVNLLAVLKKQYLDRVINGQFVFIYTDENSSRDLRSGDYPLFLNEDNAITLDMDEDEHEHEHHAGVDIFDMDDED
ncbi:MAG TPA: hypothetical protein DCY93_00625 [Firmicutes bacterium]|nr:hypothetical protein [Bacillota bacterium]